MIRNALIPLALAAFFAVTPGATLAAQKGGFEAAPRLPGRELAKEPLLRGPLHAVAEPVAVENHLGRFVIESRYGVFTVRGAAMLATRVHELRAIEELQKVQKDAAFAAALAKSAAGVASFAVGAVDDPRKAAESVGQGALTILGRAGQVAKAGAAYAGDKAREMAAPPPAARPATSASGEPAPPTFVGDPLGYNKARREWAQKLDIDPYTSNPVLRPLLDNAATASFAGNFAVGLAAGAVLAPVQYASSLDEAVRDAAWNKPPIDIRTQTEERLVALGVDGSLAREFLGNRWFTPTYQAALVARLSALGRIEGVPSVVRVAAAIEGETRVRFLLDSLAILAARQAKDRPYARLQMSELVPVGVARDGHLTAAAAVDYVAWDAEAAAFAKRKDLSSRARTLLLAGHPSPLAKRQLEKAGWKVTGGLRP